MSLPVVEMLDGSGWHLVRPEPNRPNLESDQTTPSLVRNRSYLVGGGYGLIWLGAVLGLFGWGQFWVGL